MHVQAQQSLVSAAYMELGIPVFDFLFIARAAAHDLASKDLFRPFRDSPF